MDFLPKRKRLGVGVGIAVAAIVLATMGITASDKIGDTLSAQLLTEQNDTRCPQGMVFVNAAHGFCIDRYEASPGEGCFYADPQTSSDTQVNLDDQNCLPQSTSTKSPWRYISQHQAVLACAKAGKHLATNREWYAAALGTPDTEACNTESSSQLPGKTAAFPGCVSTPGAHDMVGNVWEWTDAVVMDGQLDGRSLPIPGFVAAVESTGLPLVTDINAPQSTFGGDRFWLNETGAMGVFRGGSHGNGTEAGVYSFYAASPPTFVGAAVGFRCAR